MNWLRTDADLVPAALEYAGQSVEITKEYDDGDLQVETSDGVTLIVHGSDVQEEQAA